MVGLISLKHVYSLSEGKFVEWCLYNVHAHYFGCETRLPLYMNGMYQFGFHIYESGCDLVLTEKVITELGTGIMKKRCMKRVTVDHTFRRM